MNKSTVTKRHCGDCQLCCKLLPMSQDGHSRETAERLIAGGLAAAADFAGMIRDFDKPAGAKCPYQKHHKGCTIYRRRPFGCRMWACRWLTGDDTAELQRPDRTHYVIDESPDFVTDADDRSKQWPVIQVWVDPSYPDAHRDPALRAYLKRRYDEGFLTLVRFDSTRAIILYIENGQWCEKITNNRMEGEHSAAEKFAAGLLADDEDARKRLAWALT